jgi:hypothetical protein
MGPVVRMLRMAAGVGDRVAATAEEERIVTSAAAVCQRNLTAA